MWTYRAELDEVVDGDTIDLRVDLGFKTYKQVRVRILGIDTAEIFGVEKESEQYKRGIKQKKFVEEYLERDGQWPLRLKTSEKGKYGRWLGEVTAVDADNSLSQELLSEWPEVER